MSYAFVSESHDSVPSIGTFVNVSNGQASINVGGVDVTDGDIVHMKYYLNDIPKGVYGVVIEADMDGVIPYFAFQFDEEVYPLTANVLSSDFIRADIYRTVLYSKVSEYSLDVEFVRANYSKELKSYNTSLNYTLNLNNEGREFFGSFKQVLTAEKLIFADYCKNYSYGVSLTEDTYIKRGNKFRKSINFNVAER
jgi:hypothetical protein